ncbi:MAG: hypothetical protein AB7P49_17655 [Bdellovibrionales bacterium]
MIDRIIRFYYQRGCGDPSWYSANVQELLRHEAYCADLERRTRQN